MYRRSLRNAGNLIGLRRLKDSVKPGALVVVEDEEGTEMACLNGSGFAVTCNIPGSTELHAAVLNKNMTWIMQDENLNQFDDYGRSFLHYAALTGDVDFFNFCLQLLRGREIIPYCYDQYGLTILHCAALSGNVRLIKACEALGISATAMDKNGNTVKHYACLSGNKSAIEYYLKPEEVILDEFFRLVVLSENQELIDFYYRPGAVLNFSALLRLLILNGNVDLLESLKSRFFVSSSEAIENSTPEKITLAIESLNAGMLDYWLSKESGEKLDLPNFIAKNGTLDLLKSYVDQSQIRRDFKSIASFAAMNRTPEILEFLLTQLGSDGLTKEEIRDLQKNIIYKGHPAMLQWYKENVVTRNFPKFKNDTIVAVAHGGNVAGLQWCKDNGFFSPEAVANFKVGKRIIQANMLTIAYIKSLPEVMMWCIKNGCYVFSQSIDDVSQNFFCNYLGRLCDLVTEGQAKLQCKRITQLIYWDRFPNKILNADQIELLENGIEEIKQALNSGLSQNFRDLERTLKEMHKNIGLEINLGFFKRFNEFGWLIELILKDAKNIPEINFVCHDRVFPQPAILAERHPIADAVLGGDSCSDDDNSPTWYRAARGGAA